jgi:hypothetical protein
MKHMDLSYWPIGSMSILILIMGMTAMTDTGWLLDAINLDPLMYAIVALGVGLIIIVWFMNEMRLSHIP